MVQIHCTGFFLFLDGSPPVHAVHKVLVKFMCLLPANKVGKLIYHVHFTTFIHKYICLVRKTIVVRVKKKASSDIAQYPVLRTVQSALHFTSLTDLFTQTPSRLLWEASSHMLQLMREGCSYTYPPLSIARYSFIQLRELEQCRVKKLLTPQHRIQTWVLVVESPKLYT